MKGIYKSLYGKEAAVAAIHARLETSVAGVKGVRPDRGDAGADQIGYIDNIITGVLGDCRHEKAHSFER